MFLSQRDVRELQFAKASIATGWKILLRELGVEPGEIQQVLLAGSFGAYLTPPAPCASGWCRAWRCRGSCRPATSPARARRSSPSAMRERAEAHSIVREVEYVELSGRADFNDLFIDELAFPG